MQKPTGEAWGGRTAPGAIFSRPLSDRRMHPSLAAALADLTLPDTDGTLLRLCALWQAGPAAVIFLRHYG